MKMWSMNVTILLLFCYACLSNGKGSVYFVSKNFFNVLHWDPVEPDFPGQKVLYSVRYQRYGEEQQFQIKEECQNITVLSCDLTAETPSVPNGHYLAQVSVNGRSLGQTMRFKPLADTILGSPNLSMRTTAWALYVNVTLPLGPNGVSIADISTRSKIGSSKTIPLYTLQITHPEWAAQVSKSTNGQFVFNLKNSQTEYCGYAAYKLSSEWGRSGSENASFCATLPDNPQMLLRWLLVGAAVLVAFVVTSVVCTCTYVKGGKPKDMPQALADTSRTCKVLQFPDRNLIISELEFYTQSDQTVYATIMVKPNVSSVGSEGYSPQDIPCNVWQGSTGPPNPEDTSAQSSEIYSAVAVHVPAEENGDFHQAATEHRETGHPPLCSSGESRVNGGISPKLTSCGAPPLPDLEACESNPGSQLLLQTVRDTKGQLVLPSFAFQLQTCAGDAVSPMSPERKPLLSDLIDSKDGPSLASLQSFDSSEWSDSGCDDSTLDTPTHPYCNNHYPPSQPDAPDSHRGCQCTLSSDATFEPGYKPNWMPANLHEPASTDSCEYRRTDYPWTWTGLKTEEEGEEDEGRGVDCSRHILLGSWTIQIQE